MTRRRCCQNCRHWRRDDEAELGLCNRHSDIESRLLVVHGPRYRCSRWTAGDIDDGDDTPGPGRGVGSLAAGSADLERQGSRRGVRKNRMNTMEADHAKP